MSSIEIPDPVITWHTEQIVPPKLHQCMEFRVEARVGDFVIFERRYSDSAWGSWDGYADDPDEAKAKAADALGERLATLLQEDR